MTDPRKPQDTYRAECFPCRQDNHGNCWRTTYFGGATLICICFFCEDRRRPS